MSTGKTHTKASLMLAASLSVCTIVTGEPLLLNSVAGALVGVMISPDRDVDKGNISDAIIKQKTGWIGARVWRWFWSGYSSSFKHGQYGSHFPPFGTPVRVYYVYLNVIVLPHFIIWLSGIAHWDLIYVLTWYAKIFFDPWFLGGLIASDVIHYTLDKLTKNAE